MKQLKKMPADASRHRCCNRRLRSKTVPRSSNGLSNTMALRPSHKFQRIDPNNRVCREPCHWTPSRCNPETDIQWQQMLELMPEPVPITIGHRRDRYTAQGVSQTFRDITNKWINSSDPTITPKVRRNTITNPYPNITTNITPYHRKTLPESGS
ncbi:hypothetical protein V6N13_084137 [Hibiscus sabdariffa]